MNGLVGWFTRNGVAANLLMGILLIGGMLSLAFEMRQESFPEVTPSNITVSVLYPGATPEEVEESICVKIEEAVQGVDDVKRIRSTASENMGVVDIEAVDGVDIRQVLDDVKVEVDAIDTFPEDAEKPIITQQKVMERVISVSLSGDFDQRTLKKIAESAREDLLALKGLTKVEVEGAPDYELSIEVEEEQLRRYRLSFDHVAAAVRAFSLNLPAGSVKTDAGEIVFRSNQQAYDKEDFQRIPVVTRPDGTRITVGDVATVVEGLAETDQDTRIDGRPALVLQAYRVGQQTTPEVAAAVLGYLDVLRSQYPDTLHVEEWENRGSDLEDRMDLLKRNGLIGLILVFVVLALFLRAGLAFWVAIGLSTAICGALWVLPWLGVSLNFLSSFGFILVLGILVDDAIVVAENIDSHRSFGKSPSRAAIDGTREVLLPVSLAVITTGFAFSPMLKLPGRIGEFTSTIAIVVIVSIAFSLIESLLILPSHLGHESEGKTARGLLPRAAARLKTRFAPIAVGWDRIQSVFSRGLQAVITRSYEPVLHFAIRRRYVATAAGLAFLIVTGGLIAGGWTKISFFPGIEGNQVIAAVKLPEGSNAEQTRRAVAVLEQTAEEVRRELEGENRGGIVRQIRTTVAEQPGVQTSKPPHDAAGPTQSRAHLGEVTMGLVSSEIRTARASDIAQLWRDKVGDRIPQAVELLFVSEQMNTGAPINVELSGDDTDEIEAAGKELLAVIATYPGTYNLADNYQEGKTEFEVLVSDSGLALGLTQRDIARQVRQAFYGEEAQRVQIGKDDVRVFVRYPADERRSLANLEAMRIRLPDGGEAAFSEVAQVRVGRGPASINRIDRRRTIVVTSDLNRSISNANEVVDDMRANHVPALEAAHPNVSFNFGGEQERQAESFSGLRVGMILAMFLMYALLAIVFKSYMQPFIVLSAIPFGIAGAFWAHFFLGMDVTFLSFIGILALMGVVVNDSLVLIDFVNRYRREHGHSVDEALKKAGPRRFRPIVLTSLTTFAGLTPILLEKSVQAAFVIPMAVSLAFGVAFGTVVILVLVPAFYVVAEDVRVVALGESVEHDAADAEEVASVR